MVEGEEAADAGPVVVDQAPGLALGVIVGGAAKEDAAARTSAVTTTSTKLKFLDDGLFAEGDEPRSTDLTEDEENSFLEAKHGVILR